MKKQETKNHTTKQTKLSKLIFPHQKINFFVATILLLGIISGSIFLMLSNETDQTSVITQIQTFVTNISTNNIDNGLALKNSLIINYIFVGAIWLLGLSMIGILINIFLTYIKGFIVGFSLSSFFLTYNYKGLLAVLIYTIPSQLLNLFVVGTLTIYSIMFSKNLLQIITSKSNNNRLMLKKYCVILMGTIIISFISSLLEVYLFPNLLKLILPLYQ